VSLGVRDSVCTIVARSPPAIDCAATNYSDPEELQLGGGAASKHSHSNEHWQHVAMIREIGRTCGRMRRPRCRVYVPIPWRARFESSWGVDQCEERGVERLSTHSRRRGEEEESTRRSKHRTSWLVGVAEWRCTRSQADENRIGLSTAQQLHRPYEGICIMQRYTG
jgi:hypothetical protein